MTAATPPAGTTTASYVYGVTRGLDPAALGTPAGIGGARVRVVPADPAGRAAGLQALVGDVDPDEFSARAVAEHREDLAWLGAIARAHHEVVATAGALAPVVPLALATVYLDDDRVAAAVAERAPTFAAALDRVTGRSEWGVKAYARPRASPSARAPASSGRDYLRARRTALHASETAADDAARAGEELHADLAGWAVAARRHRPQDAALSGRDETMVLNGAYLVADGEDDALRAAVEAWSGDERIAVELTGPWVPYSFTDPETVGGAG